MAVDQSYILRKGSFEIISALMTVWALFLLISLGYYSKGASYGRYGKKGVGPLVTAKLAWLLQELPSFIIPIFILYTAKDPKTHETPKMILLGCFLVHYFQRTFLFSLMIKGGKPTPFVIFLAAMVYCAVNGYLQVAYLLYYTDFGEDWMYKPWFHIGLCIFLLGMYINIQSDSILRNLRKEGETGYKIPQGGLFEYVSGANFLGEIMEWWGFAIACGTLPTIAFAILTICNLGPRACKHHKFYKEMFTNYPTNRKALFPFIL